MRSLRTCTSTIALCSILVAALAAGCSRQPAASPPPASQGSPSAAAQAPVQAPANTALRQPGVQTITGTVAETMDASNYTYVRVKMESGEVWAASARFQVAVGDRVTVPLETPMENFHSAALKRDFPLIYFASQITREGDPAPAMFPAHGQSGGGTSSPAPAAPAVTDPIPPPPGGTTIAEVWGRRAALAGKTVTVRGRVVKFNGGILGRNWIHLQDGSGSAKDGSNDLTVTTNDPAKVGEVITVRGTVAINKDFGAGYAYAVILESATLTAK